MRAAGNGRGIRMIGLASAAGVIALEAWLASSVGALGIPGLVLVRFAPPTKGVVAATVGGETVIAKQTNAEALETPAPKAAQLASNDAASVPDPGSEKGSVRALGNPQEIVVGGNAQSATLAIPRAKLVAEPSFRAGASGSVPAPDESPRPADGAAKDEALATGSIPRTIPRAADVIAKSASKQREAADAAANAKPASLPAPEALATLPPMTPKPDPAPEQTANVDPKTGAPIGKPSDAAGQRTASLDVKTDVPLTPSSDNQQVEVLPWDDVVPEPRPKLEDVSDKKDESIELPNNDGAAKWVKAKASARAGGVDDDGRPLYRFEFWLEPPADVKQKLISVGYEFDAPSVGPRKQESRDAQSGFHVSFGGLGCADHVTLTLKYSDGHAEQASIDGCKLSG